MTTSWHHMSGLDDWLSVARGADADELRERILTGFKAGKPFTPYVPTIDLPSAPDTVLDFGCGVGRNFPYLRTRARRVCGFDLPPMIERCKEIAPMAVDALWDDWADVKHERFDLIFAALVLQHIEPTACRSYLTDFARLSPLTYLLTRTTTDFGTSVRRGRLHDRRARYRDEPAQGARRPIVRGAAAIRGRGSL